MFPASPKSARVKQPMQLLQTLVGHQDARELLHMARRTPCRKVVLKRPAYAPAIDAKHINYHVTTKTGRFDVYLAR